MKFFILVNCILSSLLLCKTHSVQTDEACNSNENCKSNEFCDIIAQKCQSCLDCSEYNRQHTEVTCPRNVQDCGNCLLGYDEFFPQSGEKCEKVGKNIRALSQIDETDTNSPDADDEEGVTPGIYVACIFAGLFVGFAVGGVGAIMAYKLYFKRKLNQNLRAKDPEKAGEKLIEMHEMKPEVKKYSSTEENTNRTYEFLVNNTKHFPEVKDCNSVQQQDAIPFQDNTAPVLNQNLYYTPNNK